MKLLSLEGTNQLVEGNIERAYETLQTANPNLIFVNT
jgi:hypothetical protein